MGKYDVDFDDYEERSGGYDGEAPRKGVYNGELIQFNEHESTGGNEALSWIFRITEGDYKGWIGWVYTNMSTAKWKTQDIVLAIQGGSKKKMVLKPGPVGDRKAGEESVTVKKAKPVRLRIINETYEEERRAKIRSVLPMEGSVDSSDGGKKKKRKKSEDPF